MILGSGCSEHNVDAFYLKWFTAKGTAAFFAAEVRRKKFNNLVFPKVIFIS